MFFTLHHFPSLFWHLLLFRDFFPPVGSHSGCATFQTALEVHWNHIKKTHMLPMTNDHFRPELICTISDLSNHYFAYEMGISDLFAYEMTISDQTSTISDRLAYEMNISDLSNHYFTYEMGISDLFAYEMTISDQTSTISDRLVYEMTISDLISYATTISLYI
jgi:hypothetical protein